MKQPPCFAGIDIASASFAISVVTTPDQVLLGPRSFENTLKGFEALVDWFEQNHLEPKQMIICMEATGVYGELLCYFLHQHQYTLAVEPPLKVKRAFKINHHKTDAVDSIQLAKYAFRFLDELSIWAPRVELVEKISSLISSRELLVREKTQTRNSLHALRRKAIKSSVAIQSLETVLQVIEKQIKALEKQLKHLIEQDPRVSTKVDLLKSTPGVGLLLAANLLVLTNGFTSQRSCREAASYLKIAPLQHESGTSVYRNPQSPHYGPSVMRKLLSLAAQSVVTHKAEFRKYYLRKQAEGKAKRLIINNVENKLLKIIWAIIRDDKPYTPNYQSVHPKYWKTA